MAAEWFEAFGPALVLYARSWVGEGAEDLVQDVLVRAMRGRVMPVDARSWLFRAVRNAAISGHRRAVRRARRESRAAGAGGLVARGLGEKGPGRDGPGSAWFESARVESAGVAALEGREVQREVIKLEAALREVVVLRVWGGLTFEQIGVVTGSSKATAHRRFEEALGLLRAALGDSEPGVPGGRTRAKGGERVAHQV